MRRSILLIVAVAAWGCQRNEAPPAPEQRQTAAAEPAAKPAGGGAPARSGTAVLGAAEFADKLPRGDWKGTALARDVDKICNVVAYAGAEGKSNDEQLMALLEWLPKNIESADGQNFLAAMGNLEGNAKADALEEGARRAGLKGCALAAKWRQ